MPNYWVVRERARLEKRFRTGGIGHVLILSFEFSKNVFFPKSDPCLVVSATSVVVLHTLSLLLPIAHLTPFCARLISRARAQRNGGGRVMCRGPCCITRVVLP